MYVKVSNGQVEKFPYTIGLLRKENPSISFPKHPTLEQLEALGVFKITEINLTPGANQRIVKSQTPVNISGTWTLQHTLVELMPEEISSKTRQQAVSKKQEVKTRTLTNNILLKQLQTAEDTDVFIENCDEPTRLQILKLLVKKVI